MTKAEAKNWAAALKDDVAGVRKVSTHVGTWMNRPGVSITLHLDSKSTGHRIVVHKWDDEATCSVRRIKGDFWRDPDNAVEYGDVPWVDFATYNIALAIHRDLRVEAA